jgi:hypothetical protein
MVHITESHAGNAFAVLLQQPLMQGRHSPWVDVFYQFTSLLAGAEVISKSK